MGIATSSTDPYWERTDTDSHAASPIDQELVPTQLYTDGADPKPFLQAQSVHDDFAAPSVRRRVRGKTHKAT